jgi:hypothetical protein
MPDYSHIPFRDPTKISIPKEHKEAYRQLYESGILASLLKNYIDHIWLAIEGLEQNKTTEEALFQLKGRLLEILHNTQSFVPKFFPKKPPKRKK